MGRSPRDDTSVPLRRGGVYRVFLSLFLAWFYIRSGGNLFLTCWLHASFNLTPTFLPMFEPGLVVLWILVTAGIVFKDKMWELIVVP